MTLYGLRAAARVAIVIAATVLASSQWKPLPSGGASAFAQQQFDSTGAFVAPFLDRFLQNTAIKPDNEVRALWVVRDAMTTPESINRLVDFAVQTRFHILFAQVRGRGDAYYQSSTEPASPSLKASLGDFDPLRYLLTVAHRSGIQVHAWLNIYYAWSDTQHDPPAGHIVLKHPEWILSDAKGTRMDRVPSSQWKKQGIEGTFISPGVPEFRRHMADVVRELVRTYDIDGIHLDYIRYPNKTYTYDPVSRSNFLLRYGIDPVELSTNRAGVEKMLGASTLAALDSIYTVNRTLAVDSMVVAIHDAAGGKPLSAAVISDPVYARTDKGQDWPVWVQQKWVDFVVPMAYSMTPLEVEAKARIYNRLVGVDHVLIGLGVYDGRDKYLAESVGLLRDIPVAGYAIFSYNALVDNVDAADLIENAVLPADTTNADSTAADSTGQDEDN